MKNEMGGNVETTILKEIRDTLLRIEDFLLSEKKLKDLKNKKQLLKD